MSTWLWAGIMLGIIVGSWFPSWLRPVIFVLALVLWDVHRVTNVVGGASHLHYTMSPVVIGVIGVIVALFALHLGRKRGLGHLGQAELGTRWTNVRKISKWGW